MFDGAQPDFQALAQQWAQLHAETCNKMGNDIVLLRVELAATKAALEAARQRLAEAEVKGSEAA